MVSSVMAFHTCIPEILGSILGQGTGNPDLGLRKYSHSFQKMLKWYLEISLFGYFHIPPNLVFMAVFDIFISISAG
jgi:hypothetical protein